MSDHVYEEKNIALYHEYKDLNGHLSHDAFMERHPRVNAYIVSLMKKFDGSPLEFDRPTWTQGTPADPLRHSIIGEPEDAEDDFADAYANPRGGI